MLPLFVATLSMIAAAIEPPCCQITAVNVQTHTATAVQIATRRVFTFVPSTPSLISSLHAGQKVYANFSTNAVSLDGRTACCRIASIAPAPATPAPAPVTAPVVHAQAPLSPPSTTTTTSKPPTTPPVVAGRMPLNPTPPPPSISFGAPTFVNAKRGTSLPSIGSAATISRVNSDVIHLRGIEGIRQAQGLSDGAKDLLILHASTLPPAEIDHYIVNRTLAQQWLQTHPVPASAHKATQNTHAGCHALSMHCVGEAAKHAEGEAERQSEKLREEATTEWKHVTAEAEHDWNMAADCFVEQTLTAPNIPVQFSIDPEFPITVSGSSSQSNTHGAASGQATGTVTLGLPVQSDFKANLDLFYIPCLPFAVRPKSLSADGTLGVDTKIRATLDAAGRFDQSFTIPPGGGPYFPVEVIPIVIGGVPVAELDAGFYVDGTIKIAGDGKLDANFALDAPHSAVFSFVASGNPRIDAHNQPMPVTTAEAVKLQGDVRIKPALYTALQLDFDVDALTGRAGPQPYLLGEVTGCETAAGMQSSPGSSTSSESHGVTFDLDWGIDLRAEALGGGQKIGGVTRRIMKQQHLYFKDLIHSTSLIAAVNGPAQASVGKAAAYTVALPACYPYKEPVLYRITWSGNATPNVSASAPGIHTSLGSSQLSQGACTFASGQAECWSDPARPVSVTLAWPAAGSYSVAATIVKDRHERKFSPASTMQVAVNVQ